MYEEIIAEKTKIFVIATGSGGHIVPAQAIVSELKLSSREKSFAWFTGFKAIEQQLIKENETLKDDLVWQFDYKGFPGSHMLSYPRFMYSILGIFFKSLFLLFNSRKDGILISTGGLLSIPIGLAAWALRMPIFLVELNVIPGKTIAFLLPFATKIWTVFDIKVSPFYRNKIQKIEYPIRSELKKLMENVVDSSLDQSKNRDRISIALFGGSQGSESLNKLFLDWLMKNKELAQKMKIFHFYGNDRTINFQQWYQDHAIDGVATAWTDTPELIYKEVDVVISRGGAGMLNELLFFKKRSFICPLRKRADDHQYLNSKAMETRAKSLFFVTEKDSFDELPFFLKDHLGRFSQVD